ncbi:MAG: hypothetical protein JOZ78_20720 [Chroococcidiopsidaceae cyanobacterium CP_BM_ER_R8_30]|nr:hypothetical protein [Chroococcidiopsidaceae cyanobacterium CP_BM_ER_R8_30]
MRLGTVPPWAKLQPYSASLNHLGTDREKILRKLRAKENGVVGQVACD